MGDIRNNNWYSANENRAHPIDDGATGVDDSGAFVPHDILADARVILPLTLARNVYVGAIAAGPNIATVVLVADDDDLTPLAAVSVPAPVVAHRAYALRPMAEGVAGWVVFGPGAAIPYVGRLSTPDQGRLAARCVRAYRTPLVRFLGKDHLVTRLEGLVTLLAGEDIEVAAESRVIAGEPRRAIVIRLRDSLNRNVFQLYSGPCAGRPESGTCETRPIQAINDVAPDCNGNIDIDFSGVSAAATPGGGGITLTLPVSMADTCGRDDLPADDGTLANEFDDRCGSLGSLNSSHGG